ncbi:MAG: hypothetical protein JWQ23_1320 [Herminiimonas sp.]|nr:hypothetical protein [Herminiimonas sp.]
MATATPTIKSVASGTNAGAIGIVKTIVGSVTATDPSGVERILQVGDKVYANDVIQTSAAGAVLIEFVDGSRVDLGRSSQIALDNEVFNPSAAKSEQSEIQSIQDRIAAGADPTQVTEASAAGSPGTVSEGGHSFVSLAQNAAQGNVTSGFDTSGIGRTAFIVEDQTVGNALVLNNAPVTVPVPGPVPGAVPVPDPVPGPVPDPVPGPVPVPDPVITSVTPGVVGSQGNSVPEGTDLVYNVTLSAAGTAPVSYNFTLGGGTAGANDYVSPVFSNGVVLNNDGTIAVPAGVTAFTVTAGTVIDNVYENSESVPLTIGGITGTGHITDTNVPTIAGVEPGFPGIGDDSVPEGSNLVYNVTLSNPSAAATSFTFALGGGSASVNDYGAPAFSNGVTLNGNGSIIVPAGVTSFSVTVPTINDAIYESTETVPLVIGGATGTGTIIDNDDHVPTVTDLTPSASGGDLVMYEANLPGGSNPAPAELTKTATFTISNPDGFGSLALNGTTVIDSNGNLTSHPITTGHGSTLTVTNYNQETGEVTYTYQLNDNGTVPAVPGADSVYDNINILLTDGDGDTASSVLSINIVDDLPRQSANIELEVAERHTVDTNLMIILDLSGSMDEDPAVAGFSSRLAVAKAAITQLIDDYDAFGDVMVRLVTFNSTSAAQGGGWMLASDAKNLISALADNAGSGNTNYDAALTVAQTAFLSGGKIADAQNISYFLSDGFPTAGSPVAGINPVEQGVWETFLTDNSVKSHAFSMGSGTSAAALAPVAYNGVTSSQIAPVIVTDLAQLEATLSGTVNMAATGNLVAQGLMSGHFGADGAGTEAVFTVTSATAISSQYDGASHTLKIITAIGGTLTVNTSDGAFEYIGPANVTQDETEVFSYILQDADGDQVTAQLGIKIIDGVPQAVDNAASVAEGRWAAGAQITKTAILDSIPSGPGNPASITVTAPGLVWIAAAAIGNVLSNDVSGADGQLAVTMVGAQAVDAAGISIIAGNYGTLQIAANGDYTYTPDATDFPAAVSDTFNYTMRDGDGDISSANLVVTIADHNYSPVSGSGADFAGGENLNDILSGGAGDDIVYGGGGADSLDGGSGNDHLAGGTGDDILNGGEGTDILEGDAGADTLDGGGANDYLNGGEGNDGLIGGSGHDILVGGAGNDILVGGTGNDVILGGPGDDILTGGSGADTFRFLQNDASGTVAGDSITDFTIVQKDVLSLADLLQGENPTSASLGSFLMFEKNGGNTVLTIDADGGGPGTEGQKITFQNVDLLGMKTNAELIQSLLDGGNLKTDI